MNSNDIVDYALTLADVKNSKAFKYAEISAYLNEAWKKIYQKLINSNDLSFLKKVKIFQKEKFANLPQGAQGYILPRDFYQLHNLKIKETDAPLMRVGNSDSQGKAGYNIVNDNIITYGVNSDVITLEYFPAPLEIGFKSDFKKIMDVENPDVVGSGNGKVVLSKGGFSDYFKFSSIDIKTSSTQGWGVTVEGNFEVVAVFELDYGVKVVCLQGENSAVCLYADGISTLFDNAVFLRGKENYILWNNSLFQILGKKTFKRCDMTIDLSGLMCNFGFVERNVYTDEYDIWTFRNNITDELYGGWTDWLCRNENPIYKIYGDVKHIEIKDKSLYWIDARGLVMDGNERRFEKFPAAINTVEPLGEDNLIFSDAIGVYTGTACGGVDLNFPQTLLFEWLSYSVAYSILLRQANPNAAAFKTKLDEMEHQLIDMKPRDAYQGHRINNVYRGKIYG